MKLILATRNQKKKRELQEIIADLDLEVLSLDEFPDIPEVEEDGETFAENARKKALEVAQHSGLFALADDSGLEVDAIYGQPGVYSARFAGEPSDDKRNNRKLLDLLRDIPDDKRTARFKCVVAIAAPDGRVATAEGACEGHIGHEPVGDGGFGYDPLFIPKGFDETFAQLGAEVKHSISHRGRALAQARGIISRIPDL
ncbi:MAG: XTP/dITP diphosphatase [Candidatus Saccharibacteria bacterium]